MRREQLGQRSKAELIEIILQQRATLLQQQALIEKLQVGIAELHVEGEPVARTHYGRPRTVAHLDRAAVDVQVQVQALRVSDDPRISRRHHTSNIPRAVCRASLARGRRDSSLRLLTL